MTKLKVGDKAPEFKLHSTEKKEVSLTDFNGKPVVMLFFPLAFSGTCTAELCNVRDEISYYNNLGVDVVAISIDSVFTLAKFKEVENYNFTILSDFNKDVSEAYDVLYETFAFGMKGVSKRAVFVLDKNHQIQYIEEVANAGDMPDMAGLKNALTSI